MTLENIPTLQTARLILRVAQFGDWPEHEKLMTSDRAVHMGGPFSRAYSWGVFCHGIAQWHLFGFGSLSIEKRDTSQYLGQIEINFGPLFPEPELGWQLVEVAEGMGYAFEAAKAMRRWAFEVRKLPTLVSYVGPANTRSQRLANRLGAKIDDNALKQDADDLVFRHLPVGQ